MQLQLRILDFENWRTNSEIKEFKNQFEKFLMEWGSQSRTARCGLPSGPTTRVAYAGRDWPDDPYC